MLYYLISQWDTCIHVKDELKVCSFSSKNIVKQYKSLYASDKKNVSFKFFFFTFSLCFIYMLDHLEMTLSNIYVFTYSRHCITQTFDYK